MPAIPGPNEPSPLGGSTNAPAAPPAPALEKPRKTEETRREAIRSLSYASLAGAVVALSLLVGTAITVIVPGDWIGVTIFVRSSFLAPPPWNYLLAPSFPPPSSAGGAVVVLLITSGAALGIIGLGYLYRAYRQLRRVANEELPSALPRIDQAKWCWYGAIVAVVAYGITLGATFAWLATPPGGPTSPAGLILGARQGLALAGGLLAFWVVLFVALVTATHQILHEVAAPVQRRPAVRRALDLMVLGSLFYFGIVACPFWNTTPFVAALDIVGARSPEFGLLTLPAWLLLGAGSLLLARAYFLETPLASPGPVPTLAAPGSTGPVEGSEPSISTASAPLWGVRGASTQRVLSLAVAIGVVLLIYASPSAGGSFGELAHVACLEGPLLVNESVWYPTLVVNAPYGGNATGTVTTLSPSGDAWSAWTTSATNGSTTGEAEQVSWDIYRVHTGWALGPGSDTPCAGLFEAVPAKEAAFGITFELHKPSSMSDRDVSTNVSGLGAYPGPAISAIFNASYQSPNLGGWSDCAGGPSAFVGWISYSEFVRFQIPFSSDGTPELVSVTLAALTNYAYSSPVPGTFYADNLANDSSGFGSGLAFAYQPCA